MSWCGIDAIDAALGRTEKALIAPFKFWKWIKLGIIIFFIGGSSGVSSFNPGGLNRPYEEEVPPFTMDEVISQVTQFWNQYLILILFIAAFFIVIILIFSYISSVMEFVLVESLVTDVVAFWAYTRKYLRLGLNLFLIRLGIGLFLLSLLILLLLPVIRSILDSSGNIFPGMIIGIVLRVIAVFLGLAIVNGIIKSFINLSIPLAMYNEMGIIQAFKSVAAKAEADWKQILIYWLVRILIGIVAGIAVFIAFLIVTIFILIILAIPVALLYYILSGIGAQALFWIFMVLYVLVALIIFFVFILIVSVPVPVFMKYHMLSFLQMWYKDAKVPMFDMSGQGEQVS